MDNISPDSSVKVVAKEKELVTAAILIGGFAGEFEVLRSGLLVIGAEGLGEGIIEDNVAVFRQLKKQYNL